MPLDIGATTSPLPSPRSHVQYWQRSTPMPAKPILRSVVAFSSDRVTAP